MRYTALLLLLLVGCGKKASHVADGWMICAEDADKSCSECTLSKSEAIKLTMAHIAQHSKTDDEIYYYTPCSIIFQYGAYVTTTRPLRGLDANYPEGR